MQTVAADFAESTGILVETVAADIAVHLCIGR